MFPVARDCSDEFSPTSLIGTDPVMQSEDGPNSSQILNDQIPEWIPVDSDLYIITWADPLVTNPDLTQADHLDMVVDMEGKFLTVSLSESILGLADYNNENRQTIISMAIEFEFINGLPCELLLNIQIHDENTNSPFFVDGQHFELEVIETYPVELEINQEFQAVDFDASSPNNDFQVVVDDDCPLGAVNSSYHCEKGIDVTITFKLINRLDYESATEVLCNIILQDYGNPMRSTSTDFTIHVLPDDNKSPLFSNDFYTGTLESTLIGSLVTTEPGPILAIDQDIPPKPVSYFMIATTPDNGLDYFEINSETGIVSVIKELDNEFLFNEIALFILNANDTAGQVATGAQLLIELPQAETTTVITTTSSSTSTVPTTIKFNSIGSLLSTRSSTSVTDTIPNYETTNFLEISTSTLDNYETITPDYSIKSIDTSETTTSSFQTVTISANSEITAEAIKSSEATSYETHPSKTITSLKTDDNTGTTSSTTSLSTENSSLGPTEKASASMSSSKTSIYPLTVHITDLHSSSTESSKTMNSLSPGSVVSTTVIESSEKISISTITDFNSETSADSTQSSKPTSSSFKPIVSILSTLNAESSSYDTSVLSTTNIVDISDATNSENTDFNSETSTDSTQSSEPTSSSFKPTISILSTTNEENSSYYTSVLSTTNIVDPSETTNSKDTDFNSETSTDSTQSSKPASTSLMPINSTLSPENTESSSYDISFLSTTDSMGISETMHSFSTDIISESVTSSIQISTSSENVYSTFNTSYTDPLKYPSSTIMSEIEFKVNGYIFQTLPNLHQVGTIAAITNDESEIRYSWIDNVNDGIQYFHLDEVTGEITWRQEELTPVAVYIMTAFAESSSGFQTDTLVTIEVYEDLSIPSALMVYSVVFAKFPENTVTNDTTMGIMLVAETAQSFCIRSVEPVEFEDNFIITETGTLLVIHELDADNPELGNIVTVKAVALQENESCPTSTDLSASLLRNEALVVLTILNLNDNAPIFIVSDINEESQLAIGYPSDISLQRVVGSVVSFQVFDLDEPDDFRGTYALDGADEFTVDPNTGKVYLIGILEEGESIEVNIACQDAPDGFTASLAFNIVGIDMETIHTLILENNINDIDSVLVTLSQQIGVNVRQLYSTVVSTSNNETQENTKALNQQFIIEVQVYAEMSGEFLSLDEFNKKLEDGGSTLSAISFSDDFYFEQIIEDNTGLTVAVGILGAIICLEIIMIAAFFAMKMYKKRTSIAKTKKQWSREISTLGKSYENHDFENDDERVENFAAIFDNPGVDNKSEATSFEIAHEGNSLSTVKSQIFKAEIHAEINAFENSNPPDHIYEEISLQNENTSKDFPSKDFSNYDSTSQKSTSISDISFPKSTEQNVTEIKKKSTIFPPILTTEILEEKMSKRNSRTSTDEEGSEDNSIFSEDKKSNLKRLPSIDQDNSDLDRKSVAFKVLVDTVELEETKDGNDIARNEALNTVLVGEQIRL